jgi:hypothetical protein
MPLWLDQVLRVFLTVALADITYRFVETPVRRLGFRGAFAAASAQVRTQWRRLPPTPSVAGAAVMSGLMCVAAVVILVGPAAPTPTAALGVNQGGRHLALSSAGQGAPGRSSKGGRPKASALPLPKLSGFGDSVLLGARHALAQVFPGGTLDAVISRQPDPILADARAAARKGTVEPFVVLHVGNNGLIDPTDLERTLRALSGARLVLVLTDHLDPLDHYWQKPNNKTIKRVVPEFDNARVLDWDAIAGAHHNWLYKDDLHLKPAGAVAYAKLLAEAYRADVDQADAAPAVPPASGVTKPDS